jgi:acyl-CoA thioester hydrolase
MEADGDSLMVVAETYCRFKSPAFYEDVLTIRTRVAEARSRSLRFFYEVFRASDETQIAEGETMHVVTDRNKKVKSLPEFYRDLLLPDDELSFPPDTAPS